MRAELQRVGRVCSSAVALFPRVMSRSRVIAIALMAAGMAFGPMATPTPAAAEVVAVARHAAPILEGLRTETSARYEVDPAAQAIHVTVDMTLKNEVPDVDRGRVIEQTYFSHFSVPVLAEATNFRATSDGGPSTPVVEEEIPDDPWVKYAVIDLQPDIYYQQARTVRLTYDLPNQPARTTGLSRVNDAFVSFPVFADGDPGLTSVEVRLPERYQVEVIGGQLAQEERDGQIVLSATQIPDPAVFIPVVVASDDQHLVSQSVDLDGVAVEALAWPDDPQWADFVIEQLGAAVPVLIDMIGQPWPARGELDVIETAAPYAYGYAGWYSEVGNEISIGDELEPLVIVHEVSHVWFNSDLFADRWINEAFAEEYAAATLEELGQAPTPPATPDRAAPAAVALNDWGDPSILDEQSDATEQYGYAASWYVLEQIADEIGPDGMREVIAAAADDEIAYLGDPDPEASSGVTNWQRLLDLLQERGGSEQAAGLFETYVVNESQQADLDLRTTARTEYAALVERGGGWSPPLEVRQLMSDWEFAGAGPSIAEADAVLDVRRSIERVLNGTGVEPTGLEDSYETAADVADVVPVAEATLDASQAYSAAQERFDAGPGILGSVGLWWSGTGGRLDDARTQLETGDPGTSLEASAAVEQRLDDAARNGALRLGGTSVVAGAAAFGLVRWRRRQVRRTEPIRVTARPRPWPPPMSPPPRPPSLPSDPDEPAPEDVARLPSSGAGPAWISGARGSRPRPR
jgi:hypothetical protein